MSFTIVTGLWDLNRSELDAGFGRSFDHYLECFDKLLSLNFDIIVFVPDELIPYIKERRDLNKTFIIPKTVNELKKEFVHYDNVQALRTDPAWYTLNGWLQDSTQAKLEMYNPVVMSKMNFVSKAAKINPFNSQYLFWIDGGIANSVHTDFIKNLSNIDSYMKSIHDKFLMLSFDYESDYEVHGFEVNNFSRICGVTKSNYVCRGGFFGGTVKDCIELKEEYDNYLGSTLQEGFMGTEENILTILSHKHPNTIHRHQLPDSLVYSFFDQLNHFQR